MKNKIYFSFLILFCICNISLAQRGIATYEILYKDTSYITSKINQNWHFREGIADGKYLVYYDSTFFNLAAIVFIENGKLNGEALFMNERKGVDGDYVFRIHYSCGKRDGVSVLRVFIADSVYTNVEIWKDDKLDEWVKTEW